MLVRESREKVHYRKPLLSSGWILEIKGKLFVGNWMSLKLLHQQIYLLCFFETSHNIRPAHAGTSKTESDLLSTALLGLRYTVVFPLAVPTESTGGEMQRQKERKAGGEFE